MITIKASAKGPTFNYDTYLNSYFSDVGSGNPDPFTSTQIGFEYQNGQFIDLRGHDIAYDLRSHIVSGTLDTLALQNTVGVTELQISGIDASNVPGDAGDFHQLVASFMGGGAPGQGSASPLTLQAELQSDAQHYVGIAGADTYSGTKFADRIEGNLGNDKLRGGDGADEFVFDTKLGKDNVDSILDFDRTDEFHLKSSIFKGLGNGDLDKDDFTKGRQADGDDAQIVYDKKSGALFYDSDGAGGDDAVRFATVQKHAPVSFDDFLL